MFVKFFCFYEYYFRKNSCYYLQNSRYLFNLSGKVILLIKYFGLLALSDRVLQHYYLYYYM